MTNKRVRIFFVWIALLVLALPAKAQQRFFNLTADEVKVDSVCHIFSIPFLCPKTIRTPSTPSR